MKITHWKRTRFDQYQINNCYQLQVSSRAHNQSFRSYDLLILVSHHPAHGFPAIEFVTVANGRTGDGPIATLTNLKCLSTVKHPKKLHHVVTSS